MTTHIAQILSLSVFLPLLALSGCAAPEERVPTCSGQRTTTACGLNDEGVLKQTCVDGAWGDNPATCTGTDVCKNGASENQSCDGNGTQTRACSEGQWQDWQACAVLGCTDPEAQNFVAAATLSDDSCTYPPSSDTFLDYAKPHYVPGKFAASTCDSVETHHQCVSQEGCNWLRTLKNNGVCREDPVFRCLASGECICRAHDFHGVAAHNNDLELFVPLSITWSNLAPRTSAIGGNPPAYTTSIDMPQILNESLQNFTSRTDFSQKTLDIEASTLQDVQGLTQSQGLSLALKFMHVWDQAPASMDGILFDGMGIRVLLNDDRLSLEANGSTYPILGEHPTDGKIKDYQCNQLAIVVSESSPAQIYVGGMVTSIAGLTMDTIRTHLGSSSQPLDVVRIGAVNAKVWDLRVYGNNRQLTGSEVAEIGKRCGDAGQYEIPAGYPESNRRYSWGMGGYDIVPGHATQHYSSGVYVTMRIPETDTFPPIDPVTFPPSEPGMYGDNLKRMIGFWDRWHEQMFFELDMIPFTDQRQLDPASSINAYRNYDEADGLGALPGEPSNYNNPCRYVTDLFQGFNWLPEDFPGEPTSADHRRIAENGGWTRWDSYSPETYESWSRPVHEHGHTAHFTLMRTYQKVHHYIRGISGESFAEIMSAYVFPGLKSWLNTGLTYYPTIPLAFEGRWDGNLERHVFKSSQPYQEKNIDDQGLGARFYGLSVWWQFVGHYAAKPYMVGRISGDTDETPGTSLQKMRFYLAQEGLDLGELFGNYAAHVATWDWPHTGHQFSDQEKDPFQGIANWCTTNSGPDCTVDALKVQADVDAEVGTGGEWVEGPTGVNPGGFASNTIRIQDAPAGALYEISLEFEVPSVLYPDTDYHIRLTPQCKDDPRFFSSRIVVAGAGTEGQMTRTRRPQYYKIPGRTVDSVVVQVPEDSNIYILAIPTPPFELEDVRPFVDGYSLLWPFKYKVTRLPSLAPGSSPQAPIELNGDETLSLTDRPGSGFTYDCFNPE